MTDYLIYAIIILKKVARLLGFLEGELKLKAFVENKFGSSDPPDFQDEIMEIRDSPPPAAPTPTTADPENARRVTARSLATRLPNALNPTRPRKYAAPVPGKPAKSANFIFYRTNPIPFSDTSI